MTKQNELKPPPAGGILGNPRFKAINYHEDKWVALWDMGDFFQKKASPEIWVGYEYWDAESEAKAETRIRFLVGLLNGLRDPSERIHIR